MAEAPKRTVACNGMPEVHFSMEIESIEDFDDLYACGLGRAQREGLMRPFAESFDADVDCGPVEKAIIDMCRVHVHRQKAEQCPEALVKRCMRSLASCRCEEVPPASDSDIRPATGMGGLDVPIVDGDERNS